jgi:hypothetical protein
MTQISFKHIQENGKGNVQHDKEMTKKMTKMIRTMNNMMKQHDKANDKNMIANIR